MERIVVKICGIKMLEDALAAVEAGASMLGFNFYPPSPRCISPQECSKLVEGLVCRGMHVFKVGVFVNEPVDDILRVLEECNLDAAQLSGDEAPEVMNELKGRAFKAIRPVERELGLHQAALYAHHGPPPALLLDASSPGMYGGTGATGDWDIARQLAFRYPILLAGGLHPGNVGEAVRSVRPWGVDVASGVESAPGKKDLRKMQAFVRSVREFSQEVEQ